MAYVKLVYLPEKEIRHDLGAAKLERNIPLAGSVEKQAKGTGHDLGPAASADRPRAPTPSTSRPGAHD